MTKEQNIELNLDSIPDAEFCAVVTENANDPTLVLFDVHERPILKYKIPKETIEEFIEDLKNPSGPILQS